MLPSVAAVNTATRRVLAVTVGGLLLSVIYALHLLVNVAMLGAMLLAVALEPRNLVISHTDTFGNRAADEACNSAAFPNAAVICFRPPDLDTRGEALAISGLVKANGWKSVTVVTSSYHLTRAGRLIGQCTTADVQMIASHPDLDLAQWLRRFVIETGGLIDASLRPECANQ